MYSTKNILLLTILLLTGAVASAQPPAPPAPGVESVSLPDDSQYVITIHRPVMKDGTFERITDTDMIKTEPALSKEEVNKGFTVGEYIVVRVKAPTDRYAYVVNNSSWDGVELTNKGDRVLGKRSRDFIYKMTNRSGGSDVSSEQLLFMFTKSELIDKDIDKFVSATKGEAGPNISVSGENVASNPFSMGSILKLSCGVAGYIFPGAKAGCEIFGFGDVKLTDLIGNAIGVKPEKTDKNVAVQLGFQVKPRAAE